MDELLVSIIIPTYNSQKTLPVTLESIKKQIYNRNIKVIVINNHSTDRTVEIIKCYGGKCYSGTWGES